MLPKSSPLIWSLYGSFSIITLRQYFFQIMERLDFLDETKRVFREIKYLHGLIPLENASSCLSNGSNDLNQLFASLISSANFHGDITNVFGDKCKDLGGNNSSAMTLQSTASDDIGSADKTVKF